MINKIMSLLYFAWTALNWISSITPWFRILRIGNPTEIMIWNLTFFTMKRGNHPRIWFMGCCRCPFLTFMTIYCCCNVPTVRIFFMTVTIFPRVYWTCCIAPRKSTRSNTLVVIIMSCDHFYCSRSAITLDSIPFLTNFASIGTILIHTKYSKIQFRRQE